MSRTREPRVLDQTSKRTPLQRTTRKPNRMMRKQWSPTAKEYIFHQMLNWLGTHQRQRDATFTRFMNRVLFRPRWTPHLTPSIISKPTVNANNLVVATMFSKSNRRIETQVEEDPILLETPMELESDSTVLEIPRAYYFLRSAP